MLIDLATWRAHDCTARFFEELAHPHGAIILPDQDVIARALSNEVAPLDPEWNCLSQFLMHSYNGLLRIVGRGPGGVQCSREAYERARESASIYHFSGHTMGRPWYRQSRHPLRERYREAAREADLADVAEQSRPLLFVYKTQYALWRLLPQPLFDYASFLLYRLNIRKSYGI